MITDSITAQIAKAMKARDEIRLSTLRMLSSALNYERIDKQHDLSEEEELVVVKKEAKKRKDAIEAYEKAGATDRVKQEKAELAILEEYLPDQMPDDEVEKLVDDVIRGLNASSMSDMGKVIGEVMKRSNGTADGKKVSNIAKEKLSNDQG